MDLIALVLAAIGAALTLAWVVIGLVVVRKLRSSLKAVEEQQGRNGKTLNGHRDEMTRISARTVKLEKQVYKLQPIPGVVDELSESIDDLKDYTTRQLEAISLTPAPAPKATKRRKVKVYADEDEIDIEEEDDDDGVYASTRNARKLGGRGRRPEYAAADRRADGARRGPRDRSRDLDDSRRYR